MEDKKEGLRFNIGKSRHDLVPTYAQEQYVKVLTNGSEKYAERNWELGMSWSKVIASMKRHIAAFESGEDFDQETLLPHTAHIMCNAAFLTEYYKIAPKFDDRHKKYLKPKKIGVDIDDVLCDWVTGWRNFYKIKDVPHSWFFDRDILKRFDKMIKDKTIDKFYNELKPLINPKDIPFEPHCYITSRPCKLETTIKWLDVNGFPCRPVHCVGTGKSKVEVAKESGIDIFVDDRYDNFVELNNAGILCYLYDTPQNQRYNVGHLRIKSLKELI